MSAQYHQTVGQWEEYEQEEIKDNLPLTWDDLAGFYGYGAKTRSMESVFNWAASQTDKFFVSSHGSIYLRKKGLQPPIKGCILKKENEMGLIASDSGSTSIFKNVPQGAFIGRCYSIIDLGTQLSKNSHGTKLLHKIRIGWELFGEDEQGVPLTVEVGSKDMPMTISKNYTASLYETANLRIDLAAWRGRDFTEDEAKAFDISNLLGKYCMVNITQSTTNKKTYSNVSGLTPIPGALKNAIPIGVHDLVKFDLDAPDMDVFNKFHDYLKDTIQKSPEWAQHVKKNNPQQQNNEPSHDEFDDGIPF